MPNISSTNAVQDYLKAIYQLGGSRSHVPTSALADRLELTAGSVSAMLRKLDEQGLVSHTPYRGVRLTKRGTRQAVEMIRHHRLLELYLARVVGMPWDKVHAEADALEHVISEDLESRLDELLGFPTEDPHGHPIPSAQLQLSEDMHPTLADAGTGSRCLVRSVSDDSPDLLRFLEEIGLVPGARVEVMEAVPFGGGVRVRVNALEISATEFSVGVDAARAVAVSFER